MNIKASIALKWAVCLILTNLHKVNDRMFGIRAPHWQSDVT